MQRFGRPGRKYRSRRVLCWALGGVWATRVGEKTERIELAVATGAGLNRVVIRVVHGLLYRMDCLRTFKVTLVRIMAPIYRLVVIDKVGRRAVLVVFEPGMFRIPPMSTVLIGIPPAALSLAELCL